MGKQHTQAAKLLARLARGKNKTMTAAAIAQRKAAGFKKINMNLRRGESAPEGGT